MGIRLGLDAKLYFKVGGVAESGSWVEIGNTKDVTLNLEKGEADASTRANNGWEAVVGTLKRGSLEFEMVWNTTDAAFNALKDSYFDNEKIGLAVLDGDSASGQGLVADFEVMNFSRNEPLEEAITVSVTVKPTFSDTPPAWVDDGVPSSTPASPPPAPTISQVDPAAGDQDDTLMVTITGTNFQDGATADFGDGITVNYTAFANSTTLVVEVSIDAEAALGDRDVTVTNPDEQDVTATDAFTVTEE